MPAKELDARGRLWATTGLEGGSQVTRGCACSSHASHGDRCPQVSPPAQQGLLRKPWLPGVTVDTEWFMGLSPWGPGTYKGREGGEEGSCAVAAVLQAAGDRWSGRPLSGEEGWGAAARGHRTQWSHGGHVR